MCNKQFIYLMNNDLKAQDTLTLESAKAIVKFVIKSEYAKIAYALKAVKDAKKGVSRAKESYNNYKEEVSK